MKKYDFLYLCFVLFCTGCAQVPRASIVSLAEVEGSPTRFFGAEVQVEGFYNREWLVIDADGGCRLNLDHRRRLYLELQSSDNLRVKDLQFRWVSVRGVLVEPATISHAAGDLRVDIPRENMFAILTKARIEKVDPSRTCPQMQQP